MTNPNGHDAGVHGAPRSSDDDDDLALAMDYLDDKLSAEQRKAVEQRRESDPKFRAIADAVELYLEDPPRFAPRAVPPPRARPRVRQIITISGVVLLASGWVAYDLVTPDIPGADRLKRDYPKALAAQYADLGVGTNWYQVTTDDEVKHVILPDHSTVLVRDSSEFRFWGDSAALMVGEMEGEIVLNIPEGRAWHLDAGAEPLRLDPGLYAIVNRGGRFQLSIAYGRVTQDGRTMTGPTVPGSTAAATDQPRWWGWERATPIVTASVVHESAGVTDSIASAPPPARQPVALAASGSAQVPSGPGSVQAPAGSSQVPSGSAQVRQPAEKEQGSPRTDSAARATVPIDTTPTQLRQRVARDFSALPIDSPERICGTAADRIRLDEGLSRPNAAQIIVLRRCPDDAGEIVPALWARPVTTDDMALQNIMRVSREIHDGRIEKSLLAAVADETKPAMVRQAALGVLTSYVHPRLLSWVAPHPMVSGEYQVVVAWAATPVETKQGAVPLSPDVRERVRALLDELGRRGDSDPLGQIANRALSILSSVGGR